MKDKIRLYYAQEVYFGCLADERGPFLTSEEAEEESNQMAKAAEEQNFYDMGGVGNGDWNYDVWEVVFSKVNEVIYRGGKYGLYRYEYWHNTYPAKQVLLREIRQKDTKEPAYEIVESAEYEPELWELLGEEPPPRRVIRGRGILLGEDA